MIQKYNIEFPDDASDATIELAMLSVSVVRGDKPACVKHMTAAMRILWPEQIYRINYWTERRIKAFFNIKFMTFWGPSSSGKTTDTAAIVLTYWLAAPHMTMVTLCSTTTSGLMKRIYGELLRLYQAIPDADRPGTYYTSLKAILLDRLDMRNGIHGVAVQKGTLVESMGNLVGFHARRNILVIDEMHVVRPAAVEAVSNLESGEDFHFVGMGNPESRLDPLGRYSEPVKGWDSITPTDDEWETKFGKCLFFDGRKSPAIVEPNGMAKYPYLINAELLDQKAKWYGENSPRYWSQGIGFIPSEGIENTLFSESFFVMNKMLEKTTWQERYQLVAGLDPAYAEGGDRCVLCFAKVGTDTDGKQIIEYDEPIFIELEVKKDEPISYLTTRKVRELCEARGVEPSRLAIDCTGNQTQLADIIEHEWGAGIWRVNFGGPASELAVSNENPETGRQSYGNRMTELWYTFYQFGRYGHIRGIGVDAVKEFCTRRLMEGLHPVRLETKHMMFGRTGRSPDIADAMVIVTSYVRENLGIVPGVEGRKMTQDDEETFSQKCLDIPQELYIQSSEEFYTRFVQTEK